MRVARLVNTSGFLYFSVARRIETQTEAMPTSTMHIVCGMNLSIHIRPSAIKQRRDTEVLSPADSIQLMYLSLRLEFCCSIIKSLFIERSTATRAAVQTTKYNTVIYIYIHFISLERKKRYKVTDLL